ncbi:IS630 family transposase [Massilia antarctica]|uniref:IS630 family transposase n=1 Tax=Massilia antarctica TaxID=2765360 RepID=A0AA49A916_9BURK|nr:IS630 family transposase [Massilia antarctica]QPI51123.1 IS630 family transposase [Massilia antarctica]
MIGALAQLDRERQCELLYFDECGFSPNTPVQYGWSKIGQTRAVEPLAHRQRVNMLGVLRHNGQLTWTTQQRPTTRDDVIAFYEQIAAQPHSVPRIVLIDNAGIHKGEIMDKKRRQWTKHGLYLYYLPPYSPELNRIEILWKHAKHFWRRFVAKNGKDLLDEIQSLMRDFGSKFTINLPDYLARVVGLPIDRRTPLLFY